MKIMTGREERSLNIFIGESGDTRKKETKEAEVTEKKNNKLIRAWRCQYKNEENWKY